MSLPSGAHVSIGGTEYLLDEGYVQEVNRRCYVHGGRSIFAGRTDITGRPGAQNLKEDYLVWSLTRFDGEGQVVLDPADNDAQFRFYRSEGLNFRTPGQMSLNKSILSETVSTTAATTTHEGAADFSDVSGTASTTSGTDRKLTAISTKVQSTVKTPGAKNMQLDFYLFAEDFNTGATTVQASAFNVVDGTAPTSGTDRTIGRGDTVQSAKLSSGTELTANTTTRVDFYISPVVSTNGLLATISVHDVTHGDDVVARQLIEVDGSTTPIASLSFVPKGSHDYRIKVSVPSSIEPTHFLLTFDKVLYGPDVTNNTATIEVYNSTGAATLTSQVVSVDTVGTGGSAPGTKTASISFQGVAATDYRARVTRTAGKQKIWVDKVVWNTLTGEVWTIDCLDLGLGSQTNGVFTPKVWAAAHGTVSDDILFAYNSSTDVWDSTATLNDTATTATFTILAMAHSDAAQYALLSNNTVYSTTAAGVDTRRATTIPAGVGLTVSQDRLWVLSEGAAGTTVYAAPLETTVGDITAAVTVRSVVINTGAKTPDTSLRQRMCSSPTGARFFINYGDVTAKVYEVDGSGTSLEPRELADLGHGVKATSIAHEGGITFIGAQYYGSQSGSDTDMLARSCLFAIDQNGVLQRIGFFREDNPDVRPPQFIVPYQTDLYILQGNYVWRYDLVNGGIFLEYQLTPATPGNQRAMAVLFGRVFANYTTEIFVSGSVGTYRQSSIADGNTLTSSVYDFGLPSVRKSLAKIEVLTDTLASGTRVTIEYQADQNGTWTFAGQMTSGTSQNFFISGVSFETLQVRARLATTTGVSTPVVKAVTAWASAAEDEEYFDLVLLTEDNDSSFNWANDQSLGSDRAGALVNLWRSKTVSAFRDGYASKDGPVQDYLVTIEDLRIEQTIEGEGRAVCTLRVVR